MKRVLGAILIGCLTTGTACAKAAAPAPALSTYEKPDAIWDDGLAEVAVYDAHWNIYSKDRTFEARLITAKESYDMDRHVKADPPYEGREIRDVLKENLIMEIQTENYPYRFLRTVFVSRDNPAKLEKATVGSQEWCGNTFHLYRASSHEFHSYFDGEGDGVETLDLRPGDLFRDQLFATLRFASDDSTERHVRLWPSWLSNHAKPMAPLDAVIRISGSETIRAAGREWVCQRIELEAAGLKESYWFSNDEARILIRYESSDGRAFLLKEVARRDYWTRRGL